ncbi:hypothetical protein OG552_19240 [Streptomyces sp. NBC_01476]|uniref:hypothetical protein n=1 Tax=Streptomyces sp. NBC_01476 TaxID=2903881 RepID=UPI002E35D6DB|nr:hypothetical protein [Streptomyces sp. NBC_01476]
MALEAVAVPEEVALRFVQALDDDGAFVDLDRAGPAEGARVGSARSGVWKWSRLRCSACADMTLGRG